MPKHASQDVRHAMTSGANRLTPDATNMSTSTERASTYSAAQLRAFVDAFERLEFDVPRLLAYVDLRRSDLNDPDALITCEAFGRVIGAACEERRVPNLGAHVAAITPIGTYPLLDYLVVTTDTVGAALEQLTRYFHLTAAPATLTLVREPDVSRLVVHPRTDRFMSEYQTSIAVHHLRAETEHRFRASCVSLMHQPDDVADLERLLGCSVHTPAPWSGVELSRESLRLPLRRRDSALRRLLEGQAAAMTDNEAAQNDRRAVARVRAAVVSRLGHGVPAMSLVARQLAIAPRTLQRRLVAEGLTYQQVVEGVRREAAERLLANQSLTVGEIGYLLGFSEPSAFHRAFKRWHRLTPQEYRRKRSGATP